MKTYIYIVENCFNDPKKIYVGKTKNTNDRKYSHIKTYGNSIIFTVIEEIESLDVKDWKPLECFWIEQFKHWGFNIQNKNGGGGGSEFYSQETKDLLSLQRKGIKRPDSFSEKMKVSMLGKNLGKNHSSETKLKMSEAKKSKPNASKGKKRGPLNEEKKKKLRVPKKNKENYSYPKSEEHKNNISLSKLDHPSYLNPSRGNNISNSLTGYKQSEDHVNKRKEQLTGKSNIKNKKPKPYGFGSTISKKLKGKKRDDITKPITQYDLDMNVVREFPSITNACELLFNDKSKNSNITQCCQGKTKTAYGFIWRYKLY